MDIVSSSEAVRAERHARMAARLARRHPATGCSTGRAWRGGLFGAGAGVPAGLDGLERDFRLQAQRTALRRAPAGQLTVERDRLAQPDPASALELAGLPALVDAAAEKNLGPGGAALLGDGAWRDLAARIAADPALLDNASVAVSLPASDDLATAQRGDGKDALVPTARRLAAQGKLVRAFDWGFLTRSDATSPQAVGIWGRSRARS
jgi:phosphate transport system permease protein